MLQRKKVKECDEAVKLSKVLVIGYRAFVIFDAYIILLETLFEAYITIKRYFESFSIIKNLSAGFAAGASSREIDGHRVSSLSVRGSSLHIADPFSLKGSRKMATVFVLSAQRPLKQRRCPRRY